MSGADVPTCHELPELNALVQAVIVTDDGQAAAAKLADEVAGLSVADSAWRPIPGVGNRG